MNLYQLNLTTYYLSLEPIYLMLSLPVKSLTFPRAQKAIQLIQSILTYNQFSNITMETMAFNYLHQLILSSPFLGINYILQAVFFGLSLISLVAFVLKIINFSYANVIANNSISRVIVVLCFIYLKTWSTWSSWLIYPAYAFAIFMSFYTYDCACNIIEVYIQKVRGLYILQVFFYVWACIGGLFALYKLGYDQKILAILVCECVLIFIFNWIRNKHIINSAIMVMAMLIYTLMKYLADYLIMQNVSIPFHIIPYIMMAFDAEYREAQEAKRNHDSNVRQALKLCTCFVVYSLLNDSNIYIDHILFGVWLYAKIFPVYK